MSKRRVAVPVMLGAVLGLCSCAALAEVLGVTSDADTASKVQAVRDAGSLLGPYGELIATGVAVLLIGANNAYRNKTRRRQLAEVGRFTAPGA